MTSVVVMKLTATLVSTIGQARAKVAAISPRREVMASAGRSWLQRGGLGFSGEPERSGLLAASAPQRKPRWPHLCSRGSFLVRLPATCCACDMRGADTAKSQRARDLRRASSEAELKALASAAGKTAGGLQIRESGVDRAVIRRFCLPRAAACD